jgi:integrase
MANQGSIRRDKGAWYLRVYVGKKQRAFRLGPTRQFMSKKEVRAAADRKLLELNIVSSDTLSTLSLDSFIRIWYLKIIKERVRRSTHDEYDGMYQRYIKDRAEAKYQLWEYKTHHLQRLLGGIATDHDLSRETLKHIKALLSGVFRHAVAAGLREHNPVRDVLLPKSNKAKKPTPVYTLEEIRAMLVKISHPARAAVAIGAYAGLRRAEIQGLRWSDYDGSVLDVKRSQWRETVNEPKTPQSKNWVPVIGVLKDIIEEYKVTERPAPKKPYDADAMFPLSLSDLGKDRLTRQLGSFSWHALRRGLASNLFELGADDIVVQRILRHASVNVTRSHYIRVRDPKVDAALEALNTAIRGAAKEPVTSDQSQNTD